MLIGVDGNEANVTERVGVSVYTYQLLKYFQQSGKEEVQFRIYLRKKPLFDLPSQNKFFKYHIIETPIFFRDLFLPISLYKGKTPDLFFSPAHYAPRFCPACLVVTIHDLSFEFYPQEFRKNDLYKLKNWTRHAVKHAEKIIAVSENTKKDLVKVYKVPEDKIEVIYNGYRQTQIANTKSQNHNLKLKSLNHFILYIGTVQPRKNIETLIDAYILAQKKDKNLKLVIAGKKGWMYERIFKKANSYDMKDKIIFTGYVDDSLVKHLYKNAEMFVMPSLYEGFGIPILEAMDAGSPVLAADNSSLPEIAGDAAVYFNPHDKIELANKINKIINNRPLRSAMIKKGFIQVKKFSWEQCGRQTLQLLKQTAKK